MELGRENTHAHDGAEVCVECEPSGKRDPSPRSSNGAKRRRRVIVACDICRSRRTKCDGQRPACHYCQRNHISCTYQDPLPPPATSVELQLAAVNERLDNLSSLLSRDQTRYRADNGRGGFAPDFSQEQASRFKLLFWSPSIMRIFGLGSEFASSIVSLERSLCSPAVSSAHSDPRDFVVQYHSAIRALAVFSEKIHIWYPILPLDFGEDFFRTLSRPLTTSSQSCLALLVVAIGTLCENEALESCPSNQPHLEYFNVALASLPIIISEHSLCSAQCLFLLGIYYCCLLQPCQAHDYSLIASQKVLNLLKSSDYDRETQELVNRTYWAVLLLENELNAQLDLPKSEIWGPEECIHLPEYRKSWRFIPPTPSSTAAASISPGQTDDLTENTFSEKVHSYFLAEIAMRRMLNRCNTAIKGTPEGNFIYAPDLALELEYQLDTWYEYLPQSIRFAKRRDHVFSPGDATSNSASCTCALVTFLRVQYYCCKLAIFWPAVIQALDCQKPTTELIDHCQRFLESYIQVLPSLVSAFNDCIVNRWTLYLSIFMTSIAARKAADNMALGSNCLHQLHGCFTSIINMKQDIVKMSRSLVILQDTLKKRL